MSAKKAIKTLLAAFIIYISADLIFQANEVEALGSLGINDNIQTLHEDVSQKNSELEQLNKKIDSYREKIQQKEAEAVSLSNEVDLFDNKIAKTKLDRQATRLELDTVETEIRSLDLEIAEETKNMERQQGILRSILLEIGHEDDVSTIDLIFGNENFSELFDKLSALESVHSDLSMTLEETKDAKKRFEQKRTDKETKLASLQELEDKLQTQENLLQEQIDSKQLIINQTQQSEARYRALVYELRQEQQYINQELISLQKEIEQRILDSDEMGDVSLLSYPVENYITTTTFHDPTYPFRHLFEHSGLDLAVPQGSPVRSAAPGYVAFARQGRMYGNYIMIIHGNGIATLYAHLSRILVQPDQFVARGEVIAASGGLPGTSGAGFSTGPHLHFEVRSAGIPVNPYGYLMGN